MLPRNVINMVLRSCLFCLPVLQSTAQTDLEEQIERVSSAIGKEPNNADLLLRRGDLRTFQAKFAEAAADLEKAATIRPDSPEISLAKGRLAFMSGKFEAAIEGMDRLLQKHPESREALLIRARSKARLRQHADAARDFSEVIHREKRTEPEIFLERAAALSASTGDHLDEALRGLEEGLTKLGRIVSLQLAALEIELKMKRFDDALRRIEEIAAKSQRQEVWLTRRGEILFQAGRTGEARAAYQSALEAIAALPAQSQATRSTTELRQRIAAAIENLHGK